MKESLKIKNQNAYFHVAATSLVGGNESHNSLCNKNVYRVKTFIKNSDAIVCVMKTIYYLKNILIPIYLPGSTNLGRVVYAKESV